MPSPRRTRAATAAQGRLRLRSAQAFLEVADLVLDERDRVEMPGIAAGLAVLAGIAASDAICAARLHRIHRGEDHRAAAYLLQTATPDGKKLAATFLRLVDIKDDAHYGLTVVEPAKARRAVNWARRLVERAEVELQR